MMHTSGKLCELHGASSIAMKLVVSRLGVHHPLWRRDMY